MIIMIDWNGLEKEINFIIGLNVNAVETSINGASKNIIKYVKSLIAKEFKLVAKGRISDTIAGMANTGILRIEGEPTLINNLFVKYKNQNISIYISENEN